MENFINTRGGIFKMLKRLSAIIICCLLFLTSCQGDTIDGVNTEVKEEYSVDLEGYECKLYSDRYYTDYMFMNKIDTLNYDMMFQRIADVEQELNCDIILDTVSEYSLAGNNYVLTNLATGDSFAEILNVSCNSLMGELAYAGYLTPLTDLKEIIDYTDSDKYGSPAVLEAAMYEGVPYAVQPTYWINFHGANCFLIYYNRDLLNSMGLYNPQEHLEKKDWTWDNFENILKTFYIENGENNLPVLSASSLAMIQLALLSNDVRFADYVDGVLKTDIYSDKSLKALDWILNIYKTYSKTAITTKGGDGYWDSSKFVNKEVLMDILNGQEAVNGDVQYKADFTFGLMPFPCGPDAPYGKWAQWYEQIEGFGIPYSADEPESAAHVINRLFEPFEEYGDKEGLLDYYTRNVFVDPMDSDVFLNSSDNARYNYWKVGGYDFALKISQNMNSKTASEYMSSYGPAFEEVIEKYMMPNFSYMYENMYNKK